MWQSGKPNGKPIVQNIPKYIEYYMSSYMYIWNYLDNTILYMVLLVFWTTPTYIAWLIWGQFLVWIVTTPEDHDRIESMTHDRAELSETGRLQLEDSNSHRCVCLKIGYPWVSPNPMVYSNFPYFSILK